MKIKATCTVRNPNTRCYEGEELSVDFDLEISISELSGLLDGTRTELIRQKVRDAAREKGVLSMSWSISDNNF